MELTQIIVSMLEITFFFLIVTTFISYLAYKLRRNNLSNFQNTEVIDSIARTDFRASPATIIYRPDLFSAQRPLQVMEESYDRNRHNAAYNRNVRYTVINTGVSSQSFESQYFTPKELRRVG